MAIHLINASRWPSLSDESITLYSSLKQPTSLQLPKWDTFFSPFAMVLVNHRTQEIFLWRDHFGQEPLYYFSQSHQFIFSSNLPDLLNTLKPRPALLSQVVERDCFYRMAHTRALYTNQTHYDGVYRVEPGHAVRIHQGITKSEPYWQLDPERKSLSYANDKDYLEHFSWLLSEAVKSCTKGHQKIAAEISGGVDSTAIAVACHKAKIPFSSLSHVATPGSDKTDDFAFAHRMQEHLDLPAIQCIGADNFEPLKTFDWAAQLFAGSPSFIFFTLANNIHRRVAEQGHTLLLSGFGGDECVSGHAIYNAYIPSLLREKGWLEAYQELYQDQFYRERQKKPPWIKIALEVLSRSNAPSYKIFSRLNQLRHFGEETSRIDHYFSSIAHFEYELLQGEFCHHVRMRIEQSAIIAKALGFSYAYPLLYPPLVEFCFSLPAQQKRRFGRSRHLIRQFLTQHLPTDAFGFNKSSGNILPATLYKCEQLFKSDYFNEAFSNLPFADKIALEDNDRLRLFMNISAYMIKRFTQTYVPMQ